MEIVLTSLFFIIFYLLIGAVTTTLSLNLLNNVVPFQSITSVHPRGLEGFITENKEIICWLSFLFWPLWILYAFGIRIGILFYEKILIEGNDEDRIASWVV